MPICLDTEIRIITFPNDRYHNIYLQSVNDLLQKSTFYSLAHQSKARSEFIHVAGLFKTLNCNANILLLNSSAKTSYGAMYHLEEGWEGEQHGRQLVVEFEDGTGLVFLFDLGMSWARPKVKSNMQGAELPLLDSNRKYISTKSYVLVSSELSEADKNLWKLSSEISDQYGEWLESI
ncbi:MAG: hypothetical protein HRT89_08620 [Lentisphaeria bacterium]|nr:hypothetical protein [Lentisphaeria bacterium]